MGFWSFVVWSPVEIPLSAKRILIEPGNNTFNVQLDEVEPFVASLVEAGARIIQQNRLDQYEQVQPDEDIARALRSVTQPVPSLTGGASGQDPTKNS